MKLTNQQIINLSNALTPFMQKDMPYRTALRMSKNAKNISDKISDFAKDEQELIKKYAVCDEDGEPIFTDGRFDITKGKEEDFAQDRRTLFDLEIDVDIYPIAENELEDITLTPEQALAIEPIMEVVE